MRNNDPRVFLYKTPSIVEREVKNLIFYKTNLLKNLDVDEDKRERDILVRDQEPIKPSDKENPIIILATKINSVNTSNYNQFVYST